MKRASGAYAPLRGEASRTRTGDLLGAISALSAPGFSLTSGFPSLGVGSPNTFPNTLQPVLQSDRRPGGRPIAMRGGLVTGLNLQSRSRRNRRRSRRNCRKKRSLDGGTACRDHLPPPAEVGQALTARLSSPRVEAEPVERVTCVRYLPLAVGPLGQSEQGGAHASCCPRLRRANEWRPLGRTCAVAGTPAALAFC